MTHYEKLATMAFRIIGIVVAGGCLSYGITVAAFYFAGPTFFPLSRLLFMFNFLPALLIAAISYLFAGKIAKLMCAGLEKQ